MTGTIRQIPFQDWPKVDQKAWQALFREGSILDGDAGMALNWAAATRKTNMKHYAQFLGWCENCGLLFDYPEPWRRAAPENIRTYATDLQQGRAPRTVASALIGLKCVLIKMAPDEDWQWLRDLTNRLDGWAKPSKPKPVAPIPLPRMFAHAVATLDAIAAGQMDKMREQLNYRGRAIFSRG